MQYYFTGEAQHNYVKNLWSDMHDWILIYIYKHFNSKINNGTLVRDTFILIFSQIAWACNSCNFIKEKLILALDKKEETLNVLYDILEQYLSWGISIWKGSWQTKINKCHWWRRKNHGPRGRGLWWKTCFQMKTWARLWMQQGKSENRIDINQGVRRMGYKSLSMYFPLNFISA